MSQLLHPRLCLLIMGNPFLIRKVSWSVYNFDNLVDSLNSRFDTKSFKNFDVDKPGTSAQVDLDDRNQVLVNQ